MCALLLGCKAPTPPAPPAPVPPPPQVTTPAPAKVPDAAKPAEVEAPPLAEGTDEQQRALEQGGAALAAGKQAEALAAFLKATHGPLTGSAVSASLAAASLYEEAGESARARALYAGLLQKVPDLPEVHFVAARFEAERGDAAAAVKGFQKTLELQPDLLPAYPLLGATLGRMGRNEEAAKALLEYEKRLQRWISLVRDRGQKRSARLEAVDLLAVLEDERVMKAMIELLVDPDPQLRIAGAGVIADLPDQASFTLLKRVAEIEAEPFTKRVLTEAVERARSKLPPDAQKE